MFVECTCVCVCKPDVRNNRHVYSSSSSSAVAAHESNGSTLERKKKEWSNRGRGGLMMMTQKRKRQVIQGSKVRLSGPFASCLSPSSPFFFPSANPPHHARCQKDLVKNRKKKNRLVYRKTKQKVITAKPPFYFCEKPIDMARQAEKKRTFLQNYQWNNNRRVNRPRERASAAAAASLPRSLVKRAHKQTPPTAWSFRLGNAGLSFRSCSWQAQP